ncbi:MAG TPA: hypothetical protein VFA39_03205 [Steroidobacteraceae bacterium]|nr:hypothetical protein [Steroidobacteraceae bacterium]
MATRRNNTRAQEQSDLTTFSHTELLPTLREHRTADLQPSPRANAQTLLALADRLDEIEDTQVPPGRALQ